MKLALQIPVLVIGLSISSVCQSSISTIGIDHKLDKGRALSNTKKTLAPLDFADVDVASNLYLRRNYVYTYYEAISTRTRLEKLLISEPKSLGIRWALMRYYISASNFVGGCDAKAIEQARNIYNIDNYIGCLAYEFVYTRLQKLDKAQIWYARSIVIAQQRDDFEWRDVNYSKTAQTDVKVYGSFNNNDPNHLYENNDGTYSRRIVSSTKNKGNGYKLVVDDRTTVTSTDRQ